MTRTIEIQFSPRPFVGDTFAYTLRLNGQLLTYSNGTTAISKTFYTQSEGPNSITMGLNQAQGLANTLANLQTHHVHPAVSYSLQGSAVIVTVEYTGTLAVENVSATTNSASIAIVASGDLQMITPPGSERLRMAYNNHIIRFGSSIAPLYADITANGLNVHLFPHPDGTFFFNFRPFVSALINSRNFDDLNVAGLDINDPSTFIHDFTEGTVLKLEVQIKVAVSETVSETANFSLSWLAGVEQVSNHHNFNTAGTYLLSPFRKLTANSYYSKYWQGYPFDIAFYTLANTLAIYNRTNLLSASFGLTGSAHRLIFSDGRTDETLEDLLPMVEGTNMLRFSAGVPSHANARYVTLVKEPYKSGVYLKWLNCYGGYSYWLFEDTYSIDRSTKHLGEIDREMQNLEDTITRTLQMGKDSQDTMRVVAELLTEDERGIVEGILDSPKIYLFTGQPYSRSSSRDWMEITLKTTGTRLKNARQPLTNFTFDLELPQRYTQRL